MVTRSPRSRLARNWILLARQVESRELRRSDQEDLLRLVHDLEGEFLQVARKVGADDPIGAAEVIEQPPEVDHLEPGLGIQSAGMHDVQGSETGDELRPQILVDLLGLLARIEHGVAVPQLQHEADQPAIQVEVAKEDSGVIALGEGDGGVDRQGGGADSGFCGQERIQQFGAAQ